MNSGMHIEKYGLGTPEFVNPLLSIIEDLFSHELHANAWKKYTKDSLIELIKTKVKEKGFKLTDRHYISLKRKLDRVKKIEEALEILTNVMFGKMDG